MAVNLAPGRVCKPVLLRDPVRKHSQVIALARVIAGYWMLVFAFVAPANISFAQAPEVTPKDSVKQEQPVKPGAPSQLKGVYATYEPKGVYSKYGGNYRDCMTSDRTVKARNLGVPLSELNSFLDRKDKTRPPKNEKLANLIKQSRGETADSKDYSCPGLGNGHALNAQKVCKLWASRYFPGNENYMRPKVWDSGRIFCEIEPGGGGSGVVPISVCQIYANSKLGLKTADISTFVRWSLSDFAAVCFYIKKTEVEANIREVTARDAARIKKIRAMNSKTESFRFVAGEIPRGGIIDKTTERIFKEKGKDFEITIDLTTPEVGKRIVDLARADPKSAAKYISWLDDGIQPDTVMWNPDKMAKTAIGHGYNIRVFEQTLDEMKKDLIEDKKMLDKRSNDISNEKNAVIKAEKFDAYIQNTRKHKAMRQLKSAMEELVDITQKKKVAADEEAEKRRVQALKKRFLSIFE